MNVSGPGGLPGLDPQALKILAEPLISGAAPQPARPRDPASTAIPANPDQVVVSLPQLTSPPVQQLLHTIEARLFPPQHLPPAMTTPKIDEITMNEAKESALKSVAKAAHSVELKGIESPRIPENLDPQTVLALATQLIATQQYPNYLRATELGNEIASWYDGPLTVGRTFQTDAARPRGGAEIQVSFRWLGTVRKLWRRAPLLVLLIAWFIGGIVVPSGIWGPGFLVLIVLQFLLSVRGAFRRKV